MQTNFQFYLITYVTSEHTSPKKVYVRDVGIKKMITGFRDLGASYENLVF